MKLKRKYNNHKETVNGIEFDSKKEAKRYKELLEEEKLKHIFDLKLQVPFTVVPSQKAPNGTMRPVKYIADFTYFNNEGEFIVEDVKGFKTPEYIIKRKLMFEKFGIEVQEK